MTDHSELVQLDSKARRFAQEAAQYRREYVEAAGVAAEILKQLRDSGALSLIDADLIERLENSIARVEKMED